LRVLTRGSAQERPVDIEEQQHRSVLCRALPVESSSGRAAPKSARVRPVCSASA
jgi:hypothetical protein